MVGRNAPTPSRALCMANRSSTSGASSITSTPAPPWTWISMYAGQSRSASRVLTPAGIGSMAVMTPLSIRSRWSSSQPCPVSRRRARSSWLISLPRRALPRDSVQVHPPGWSGRDGRTPAPANEMLHCLTRRAPEPSPAKAGDWCR